MTNMATKTLSATFPSVPAAFDAARRIERYGVGSSDRTQDGPQLKACVDDAYCELVLQSFRDCGAKLIAISQNRPASQDWMGHHDERMTSTGVPPGQGDAEAGLP